MRTAWLIVGAAAALLGAVALRAAPAADAPAPIPGGGAHGGGAAAARGAASAGAASSREPHVEESPDGIPLAGESAGGVRVPSAPGAWGGERDGKPTLSDRVVRYQIEARLDPKAHTLQARERLSWRNRSDRAVRAVYLHLYLNAFEGTGSTLFTELGGRTVHGISVADVRKGDWGFVELRSVEQGGRAVPWRFVHPDGGPGTDHTVARLDLPQAVPPGAETTLDIAFFDRLPRALARTGHHGSYHLGGQWFPKIGVLELQGERGATAPRWNCHEFHLLSEFYADFGSYDVSLTVPKGFTVGATGVRLEAPRETAEGVVHRFTQEDVHDFAWVAWDGFAPPLTAQWTGPGSPPVAVTVLYPPEYAPVAQPTLQATLASLKYFSETLGPYPYGTITAVVPPFGAEGSGGMEYPTFFTSEGNSHYYPNQPYPEYTAIHEFGHGYFYGILASNEFEEPFLDEGLNEFWGARMDAQASPPLEFQFTRPWARRLGLVVSPPLSHFDLTRLFGSGRDVPDVLAANAWARIGSAGFVYSGTTVRMHDLEARLGGDKLARAFQEYYRRWKFRHPSIADLQAALADATGDKALIDEFFDQHVFHTRTVDDRLVSIESEELLPLLGSTEERSGRGELDGAARDDQVQKARKAFRKAHPGAAEGAAGPFPYRTTVIARRHGAAVPQTVLVKFADGSEQRARWDEPGNWKKLTFTAPARAVSAQLDPDGRIYADPSKLDDGRTVQASPLASRRWTLEAAAWLQLALALVEAL